MLSLLIITINRVLCLLLLIVAATPLILVRVATIRLGLLLFLRLL